MDSLETVLCSSLYSKSSAWHLGDQEQLFHEQAHDSP